MASRMQERVLVKAPHYGRDRAIDKPDRPCSRCSRNFSPTVMRRMLCQDCFKRGDHDR